MRKNCTVAVTHKKDFSDLDTSVSSSASMEAAANTSIVSTQDTNTLLLQEMKSLSSKMNLMEKRLATTEKQLQASTSATGQHDKGKEIKKKVPAVPQPQTSEEDSSEKIL